MRHIPSGLEQLHPSTELFEAARTVAADYPAYRLPTEDDGEELDPAEGWARLHDELASTSWMVEMSTPPE